VRIHLLLQRKTVHTAAANHVELPLAVVPKQVRTFIADLKGARVIAIINVGGKVPSPSKCQQQQTDTDQQKMPQRLGE